MQTISWIITLMIFTILILISSVGIYFDNPISHLPTYLKHGVYYGASLTALAYVANVLAVYGSIKKSGLPTRAMWRRYWSELCKG